MAKPVHEHHDIYDTPLSLNDIVAYGSGKHIEFGQIVRIGKHQIRVSKLTKNNDRFDYTSGVYRNSKDLIKVENSPKLMLIIMKSQSTPRRY